MLCASNFLTVQKQLIYFGHSGWILKCDVILRPLTHGGHPSVKNVVMSPKKNCDLLFWVLSLCVDDAHVKFICLFVCEKKALSVT